MQRATILVVVAVAMVVMLIATACGEEKEEKATPTARATVTVTASPSPAASPVETASPQVRPTGGASGDLTELAAKGLNATFKVTYDASFTVQGEAQEGTLGMFSKPPKTRIDSFMPVMGQEVESRLIAMDGDAIICSKEAGQWSCSRLPSQEEPVEPEAVFTEEEAKQYDVSKTEGREIAGQSTECFLLHPKLNQTDLPDESEVCLNKDGVVLYAREQGPGADSSLMEATDYSMKVSDGDFEPPAEPTELEFP